MTRSRGWRKMTWALWIWCALSLVRAIAGAAGSQCADEANELSQSACEAGTSRRPDGAPFVRPPDRSIGASIKPTVLRNRGLYATVAVAAAACAAGPGVGATQTRIGSKTASGDFRHRERHRHQP